MKRVVTLAIMVASATMIALTGCSTTVIGRQVVSTTVYPHGHRAVVRQPTVVLMHNNLWGDVSQKNVTWSTYGRCVPGDQWRGRDCGK